MKKATICFLIIVFMIFVNSSFGEEKADEKGFVKMVSVFEQDAKDMSLEVELESEFEKMMEMRYWKELDNSRKIMDKKSDSPKGYNQAGILYGMNGVYSKGIRYLKKSLELNDSQHKIYNNLGNMYYCQGNAIRAIENYKSAIQLDTGIAIYYFNISMAYYASVKIGEYHEVKEKAISLNPDLAKEYEDLDVEDVNVEKDNSKAQEIFKKGKKILKWSKEEDL